VISLLHTAITERFRDEGLILKHYINSSVYLLYFLDTYPEKNVFIQAENKITHGCIYV